MNFTQNELTSLYWLLTQLRDECEVDKKWELGNLFNKIETLWGEAK